MKGPQHRGTRVARRCHWVWGPNGWLMTWGVCDFAGGLVVHVTAGFSALATVMALPSREKLEGQPVDTTPHNVPYVALGTALLWFGSVWKSTST